MSKKLFSKVFILLLVVGLLFAVAPTGQALAQTVPYTPDVSIQKAADEIVNSQMTEGGWGATGMVAPQTVGVIGSALIDAYARTEDAGHLASINAAAAYLMTKTNNFSPADGMFAAKLDALLGGTTYTTFVKTNFFDKLADGTYGATGDIDTAEYIHDLYSYYVDPGTGVETRVGDGYMNHEDPALGLISADLCGADVTLWVDAVKTDLNTVDMVWDFDPMMVASKGIYSLHFVGQTFDPTGGSFAAASDLAGMAAQLAGYQLTDGGFAVDDYSNISDVEATGYVIIALDISSPAAYQTAIQDAADWLLSVQNAAGYWEYWGTENYANTAAAVQAVNEAYPAVTVPPTKLNMDPATITTTDTCASSYTVEVLVTDVTDLTSYELKVLFDETMVQVTSVTNSGWFGRSHGVLLDSPNNVINNTDGYLIYGKYITEGLGSPLTESGSGSLITITFKPLVAGESGFVVDAANSMLVNWPDALPIPFEVTGGATFDFGAVVKNVQTTTQYCDLATAVAEASATTTETLQLLADFTIPETVTVDKALTLDLNGKVASFTPYIDHNFALEVTTGGALTIDDALTGGTLRAIGSSGRGINVNGGSLIVDGGSIQGEYASVNVQAESSMTLNDGTIGGVNGTIKYSGIGVTGTDATLTVIGGTIQSYDFGIYGNGLAENAGTIINIEGGAITSTGAVGEAIYHPQAGTLNISGGTITGHQGVEMRSGTLNVTGGTIHAIGNYVATADLDLKGGYSTDTGDAIFVGTSDDSYAGNVVVNISDDLALPGSPVIMSDNGYALREAVKTGLAFTNTASITVTGGRFTGGTGAVSFSDQLVAANTAGTSDLDLLPGGAYNTDPGGTPDYVYAPYATYQNTTDSYFYIEEVHAGTIDAYTTYFLGIKVAGDGTFVDFRGEIPWYPADPAVGRTQANRVAVKITEPTGGYDAAVATMTIGTKTWIWNDIRTTDGWVDVWQKIISVPQTVTVTMKWNNVSTQTLLINILEGSTLQLPPEPIITSDDIQGYYLTGEAREFNVSMKNPDLGANYARMIFDYRLNGVSTADITSFEYYAQDLDQWITMGSRATETYGDCSGGGGVCGQFGWAPGGFGPVPAGFENTSKFRINFANGFSAPLTFTLDLSGKLAATDTAWTPLTTYTGTLDVYDKATVTVGNVDPYFLVDEPGAFNVTVSNPTTGRYYNNTVVFDVEITPPTGGGISALVCTSVAPMPVHTWTFDSTDFTVDSGTGKITARLGGEDDYFIVPNLGIDGVVNCTATFTKEGTYSTSGNMVDVVSTAPVVERIVSNAVSASVDVYRAPEISAVFPAGPYLAGVPVTIPITITNPDGLTDPFKLQVVLSDGTTLTFVVDPAGYPTTQNIVITFEPDQSGDVVLNLYDDTNLMNGRLLDTATQTGVVVNSGFTVTGNFSMQGNLSRAGVPVTFTWGGDLVEDYGPTGYSTAVSGTNFSQVLTYGGSYTITTNQPRYLNVYEDGVVFFKTINLTGDRLLPELRLRGGNAYWRVVNESNAYTDQYDNTVNGSDASVVGTDWNKTFSVQDLTINCGDVNFDGKVNIQDLALVGGNYYLTSADAYGTTWLP